MSFVMRGVFGSMRINLSQNPLRWALIGRYFTLLSSKCVVCFWVFKIGDFMIMQFGSL